MGVVRVSCDNHVTVKSRLERNREREGISNMEYLKNVILKVPHTTHPHTPHLSHTSHTVLTHSRYEGERRTGSRGNQVITAQSPRGQICSRSHTRYTPPHTHSLHTLHHYTGEDMDLPGAAVGPPSLGGGATSKLTNYIHRWTGY